MNNFFCSSFSGSRRKHTEIDLSMPSSPNLPQIIKNRQSEGIIHVELDLEASSVAVLCVLAPLREDLCCSHCSLCGGSPSSTQFAAVVCTSIAPKLTNNCRCSVLSFADFFPDATERRRRGGVINNNEQEREGHCVVYVHYWHYTL